MGKFTNPLNNIKIASPCSADWNQMIGDERRRFCSDCKLNVYNLSGMSQREAENLLLNSEGRLCVRFYRRADGTVLTKDCPVGWRAIKQRITKIATAFASLVFAILSGIGLNSYFQFAGNNEKGQIEISDTNFTTGAMTFNKSRPAVNLSEQSQMTMGNVSIKQIPTEGRLSNISEIRNELINKKRR